MRFLMASSPKYVRLEDKLRDGSGVAAAAHGGAVSMWRGRVEYVHAPHNGNTAPTIILRDYTQLKKLSRSNQVQAIRDLLDLLDKEVREGGWDVVAGQYALRSACLYESIPNWAGICAMNAEQIVDKMADLWGSEITVSYQETLLRKDQLPCELLTLACFTPCLFYSVLLIRASSCNPISTVWRGSRVCSSTVASFCTTC